MTASKKVILTRRTRSNLGEFQQPALCVFAALCDKEENPKKLPLKISFLHAKSGMLLYFRNRKAIQQYNKRRINEII
jgi:hypothetical protein